jgi:hypothetical protein
VAKLAGKLLVGDGTYTAEDAAAMLGVDAKQAVAVIDKHVKGFGAEAGEVALGMGFTETELEDVRSAIADRPELKHEFRDAVSQALRGADPATAWSPLLAKVQGSFAKSDAFARSIEAESRNEGAYEMPNGETAYVWKHADGRWYFNTKQTGSLPLSVAVRRGYISRAESN